MKNSLGHIEAVGCEGKFPRGKGRRNAELNGQRTACSPTAGTENALFGNWCCDNV